MKWYKDNVQEYVYIWISTDGGIERTSIYYEYIKCLLTYRKTVEKLNGEMIYKMLCDTYTQVYNMIQSKHLVPGNNI